MATGTSAARQSVSPASPNSNSWLCPKYLFFAFLGLLYLYVLWNDESFLVNSKDPEWQHIASFRWWLLPHGLAAGCALFPGPLQFSDRRFAALHRILGRIYVAGVFLGAPIGIYIQHLDERLGDSRSFTVATVFDAGIWIATTAIAWRMILQGRTEQHRRWMTRSFACVLIFLEVRVVQGLTGWEHYSEAIVWSCVAMAVPLADMAMQWEESHRLKSALARAKVT
jgi:uncharacterized membrane protein